RRGWARGCLSLLGSAVGRDGGSCWTLPEWDGRGRLIGVMRRYGDGRRPMATRGSKRGLTLPDGWQDRHGPLLLAEGASDALALHALGLAAVGRPSCSAAADLLAELLAGEEREVLVVGDNDEDRAGENGAAATAAH